MPDTALLGSFPPPDVRALEGPGIEVPGYLADVSKYFLSARVFVAPLRYGAGMKGKIGQALAFGLPIVTTSLGAEGMDLRDGKDVLIADNSHSFADAVARLYKDDDLWLSLSARGLEIIAERWSPRAMSRTSGGSAGELHSSGTESPGLSSLFNQRVVDARE